MAPGDGSAAPRCCGRAVGGDGVGGYEAKFLLVRTLLGAAEAGFFPGMIYLTSRGFPAKPRQHYGAVYGRAAGPDAGSPLSGALLEMHGFMGHPGWFWMFVIEGLLAVAAGAFTFFWLDDSPQHARFLSAAEKQALISELAREEEKRLPRACPMRCVTGGSGSWR